MIDSFEPLAATIREAGMPEKLGLETLEYGFVTLHRPSNVDVGDKLALIVRELESASEELPLVFPVHPRTRQRLSDFGLMTRLEAARAITLTEPLSYIEFMSLVRDCRLALTDSGGIQEESSYLGIPCLTVRDNTERPVTVTEGTNRLIKSKDIGAEIQRSLAGQARFSCAIDLWDGRAAGRAADSLERHASRP